MGNCLVIDRSVAFSLARLWERPHNPSTSATRSSVAHYLRTDSNTKYTQSITEHTVLHRASFRSLLRACAHAAKPNPETHRAT